MENITDDLKIKCIAVRRRSNLRRSMVYNQRRMVAIQNIYQSTRSPVR